MRIEGIERETGADPTLSLIWLHGLGADATDFLPIVGELELPVAARFVFPSAPERRVTINNGMIMRAWYDILGFGPDAPEDLDGLTRSVAIVRRLIERERNRGIEDSHIVVAGFSQGGAVAQHAGLTGGHPLGGILGLSTYLPAVRQLRAGALPATTVPVKLMHGTHDPVIPIGLARRSVEILGDFGIDVDWSEYSMGHEVCREQIDDLSEWLRRFESR